MIKSLAIVALLAMIGSAHAGETAFESGLARFQAGDFAGALPLLEQAHSDDPHDADTALLLGICYFRTDHHDLARPVLEQAERDGDPDDRASARVFLGLIAEETGHDERARVYYEQVAHASPELGASARLLLDQAGPSRWLVVGVVRPEYDSNVELLPSTPGRGHKFKGADGELDLVLAVSARLFQNVPLVVDQTLAYDKQATLSDYDWLSDRLGATYVATHGAQRGSLAYHFETSRLGNVKYQNAHIIDVTGRQRIHDALAIGARYSFGVHHYGGDYTGYTGLTHTGALQLIRGTRSTPVELAVGYQIEREGTSDPSLTMFAHGPRGDLRYRAWKSGELRASLTAQQRLYDMRTDIYVSTDAALYLDVSTVVGLVVGASFTSDTSDDKSFSYTKWTAFGGVIFALGS